MTTTNLRPICRPVHTGLFQSKEFRVLPEDGHARMLLLCLLIHPHGGSFHLPGLYNVGRESLREVAGMAKRPFAKALADLAAADLIDADETSRLFWVPSALRLVGPPGNPNVVKGYARSLAQLPTSRLVVVAASAYLAFLKRFGSSFWEPFAKAFGTSLEGFVEDEENVSQSINQNLAYINKDRDKNIDINSYSHEQQSELVRIEHVMSFVKDAGWPNVSELQAKRWLKQLPGLQTKVFSLLSKRMYLRDDIRDPLAYMAAVLLQTDQDIRGRTDSNLAAEDVLIDGKEINFNE